MPLPDPNTERRLLHTRDIQCRGFEREDGLVDIEGWMTDVKSYSFPNRDRGEIQAGEPLHGMGLRLTLADDMTIVEVTAVMDHTPFTMCPGITPNFQRLKGLKIGPGFRHAAKKAVGGTEGCTHLVELLSPMATTAFQTMVGRKSKRLEEFNDKLKKEGKAPRRPPILDTCHTWSSKSDVVRDFLPDFYTGDDPVKENA